MIIPDNLSGFVNVTAGVDIVDVLKALPEQEQTWMLLKAFWLFTPENVRKAVEIYLNNPLKSNTAMYIPVPVDVEDLLHEASIDHAEEFLEMVLNKFFSRADVEDAIRAHFKQRLQKDEPLPDFIDPSKL